MFDVRRTGVGVLGGSVLVAAGLLLTLLLLPSSGVAVGS